MTQPLFQQRPAYAFEKNAAIVSLPEDPNQWAQEIEQEIYKQIPYIADFQPHVEMQTVDGERGYGLGHIEVRNKTELSSDNPQDLAAAGIRVARIPVIITNRKLAPLDLLITPGDTPRAVPLTEQRLRQAMFRPQAFDVTSRTPGDMSMVGQLYPPYRQNYGFGGGGTTVGVDMGKLGSADKTATWTKPTEYSLDELLALGGWSGKGGEWSTRQYVEKRASVHDLPIPRPARLKSAEFLLKEAVATASSAEVRSFLAEANTPYAQWHKAHNDAYSRSFEKIGHQLQQPKEIVDYPELPPSVLQVTRVDSGYRVKSASIQCWAPTQHLLSRAEAIEALGPKIVLAADTEGSATIADDALPAEAMQEPPTEKPQLVTRFGLYRCRDHEGKEIVGYVFPSLLTCEGESVPTQLFTNGSVSAWQGEICGIQVAQGASLTEGGQPDGLGTFYRFTASGTPEALEPMIVTMPISQDGSVHYMAEDPVSGERFAIQLAPNIQRPTLVDGVCLIPSDFRWIALGTSSATALASNPTEYAAFSPESKLASVRHYVEVRATRDGVVSVSGEPVAKVAHADREMLDLDGALFLLGALGVSGEHAATKIAMSAHRAAPVRVPVRGKVVTAAAYRAGREGEKLAHARLAPALRQVLVKEAASLPDPTTVDAVLSLGFINPENLSVFVGYLPTLDDAQGKICQILLGARVGHVPNVPVPSLEKTMRALEDVIEGLRTLAFSGA